MTAPRYKEPAETAAAVLALVGDVSALASDLLDQVADPAELLIVLGELRRIGVLLDRAVVAQVDRCLAHGDSWDDIAVHLEINRSTARDRFRHLLDEPKGGGNRGR